MKRRTVQTSWDSTTSLRVPGRCLAIYGSESPRVINTIEVVDGDGEVLLLESGGTLKVELKSSLKNKD
jgi:hypothetical protein